MGAGPDAVHDVVKRILAEDSSAEAAAVSSPSHVQNLSRAEAGLHDLPPLGARVSVDGAAVQRTGRI